MQPSFVFLHLFVVLHLRIERVDNFSGLSNTLLFFFSYGSGKHTVFRQWKPSPEELFIEQGEWQINARTSEIYN